MNLFRVRGIQLAVHFSFFLLLVVNAFRGWAFLGGWSGMWWSTAVLIAFFACVVLHELGHSLTAMHYGVGIRRILLLPIGGMAEFDAIPRQPRRELLITIAGPAVNFVIAGLLWLALPAEVVAQNSELEPASLAGLGEALLTLNLMMGCFNLVPAFPMDGGRILRALLATRMNYLRATFWAVSIGKVLSVLGVAVGVYFEGPMLAALFAFIFVMGEIEYRATKQREIDDAHLRATFDRLHTQRFSPNEPPLLAGSLDAPGTPGERTP